MKVVIPQQVIDYLTLQGTFDMWIQHELNNRTVGEKK